MKTLLAILLTASASSAAQVVFTWNYDYDANVVCSATVTKNCIKGFRLYSTQGGRSKIADAPNPANATGAVTGISYTATWSAFGQQAAVATAVALDANGAEVESADSNSVSFQVTPKPPTSLTGQVQ